MGVSASHRALAARRSPWDEPIERVKRPPEAVRLLNTLPSFPLRPLFGQKFTKNHVSPFKTIDLFWICGGGGWNKKPCFAIQNYRFILEKMGVVGGGWLEG